MGGKKIVIGIIAAAVIVGAGLVAFSVVKGNNEASRFQENGYILDPDSTLTEKRNSFASGTAYKQAAGQKISFENLLGTKVEVPSASFIHYDDGPLAALARGVIVDTDDLYDKETGKVNNVLRNYYALAPSTAMINVNDYYSVGESETPLTFQHFVWKIADNKYMIVSTDISVTGVAEDAENGGNTIAAGKFIELTYVDGGIIRVQTEEKLWQTVSKECYATLGNGLRIDLYYRNIFKPGEGSQSETVLLDFSDIVLDSNAIPELSPVSEDLESTKQTVIPYVKGIDGKKGATGTTGDPGEDGQEGDMGTPGVKGEDGDQGDPGQDGKPGQPGENGESGDNGQPGDPGDPGDSEELEGTVLDFPMITISGWQVTGTTASGTLVVTVPSEESNMFLSANALQKQLIDAGDEIREEALTEEDKAQSGKYYYTRVYLVDMSTGETVCMDTEHDGFELAAGEQWIMTDTKFTGSSNYNFDFVDLSPDHEYRLVVAALTNTRLDGARNYVRNYLSKTFWTTSTGVIMEAGASTKSTVSVVASREGLSAANGDEVTFYFYNDRTEALAAELDDKTGRLPDNTTAYLGSVGSKFTEGVTKFTCTFDGVNEEKDYDGFHTNESVYVRMTIKNSDGVFLSGQTLTLKTLKETPAVGAPTLVSNRANYGLELSPGVIYDPDSAISYYKYEVYNVNDLDSEVNGGYTVYKFYEGTENSTKPVKTLEAYTTATVNIPIDGVEIKTGMNYVVRTIAVYYDNSATVYAYSPLSNAAAIVGSRLPYVYFSNEGSAVDISVLNADDATVLSKFYDQIYGQVYIVPGQDTTHLMLDESHHPVITFSYPGEYYASYTVYLEGTDEENLPEKGTYLFGTYENGIVIVDVPIYASSILAGRLTKAEYDEGCDYYHYPRDYFYPYSYDPLKYSTVLDYLKGLVKTGTVQGLEPNFNYYVTVTGDLSKDGTNAESYGVTVGRCVVTTPELELFQADWKDDQRNETLADVFRVYLKLTMPTSITDATSIANYQHQTETLSAVSLTLYSGTPSSSSESKKKLATITLSQTDIAALFDEDQGGLMLTADTFGLNGAQKDEINEYQAVYIHIDYAADYTIDNKMNQPATLEDGKVNEPYTNLFTVLEPNHVININDKPSDLPNEGEGITVEPTDYDSFNDPSAYNLTINYDNSAGLAHDMTVYVFDFVDYYADYRDTTKYKLSDYYNYYSNLQYQKKYGNEDPYYHIPMSAVTTVTKDGNTPSYLGKVTIPIDSEILGVYFVPQTAADYFGTTEADKAAEYDRASAIGGFSTVKKDDQYYLFYNQGSEEPERGHMFVFAYTLTYYAYLDENQERQLLVYPFAANDEYTQDFVGGISNAAYIPHSDPVNAPFDKPIIYAYQAENTPVTSIEGSNRSTARTEFYIYDRDGVLQVAEDNSVLTETSLFYRMIYNDASPAAVQMIVEGEPANASVPIHSSNLTLSSVWDEINIVFNPDDTTIKTDSSYAVEVPVQYYTDKYLEGDAVSVLAGSYNNSVYAQRNRKSDESSRMYMLDWYQSFNGNSYKAIPKYENAYTFYYDAGKFQTVDANGTIVMPTVPGDLYPAYTAINVELKEAVPSSGIVEGTETSLPVNRYYVTISLSDKRYDEEDHLLVDYTADNNAKLNAAKALLNEALALRMTFTNTKIGKTIVIDKFIRNMDSVDGSVITWDNHSNKFNFEIVFSKELADLAGYEGTELSVCLMQETGVEGFDFDGVKNSENDMAVHVYSYKADITAVGGPGYQLSPAGNLVYSYNLSSQKASLSTVVGKVGSSEMDLGLYGGLLKKAELTEINTSGKTHGQIALVSTRYNSVNRMSSSKEVYFSERVGALSGDRAILPAQVAKTENLRNISVLHADGTSALEGGKFQIPSVTPLIEYDSDEDVSLANGLEFTYELQGVPELRGDEQNFIYFLIERVDEATGKKYTQIITEVGETGEILRWEDVPSEDIASVNYPTGYTLVEGSPKANPFDPDAVDDVGSALLSSSVLKNGWKMFEYSMLESETDYIIYAYYLNEVGQLTRLLMEQADGTEVENFHSMRTLASPEVSLFTIHYYSDAYDEKYIVTSVDIANALGYYYTMELYDPDGNFLTYLDVYDGTSKRSLEGYEDDEMTFFFSNSQYDDPVFENRGNVYKMAFDTENNKLAKVGDEAVYLQHGKEYTVCVKAYNRGRGPAYDENYDLTTDPENLLVVKEWVEDVQVTKLSPEAIRTFTVNKTTDQMGLDGGYNLIKLIEGETVTFQPYIAFYPTYYRRGSMIRDMKLAVAVIQKRSYVENGNLKTEILDVTDQIYHGIPGMEGVTIGDLAANYLEWGDMEELRYYIDTDTMDPNSDYSYECFIYGIADNYDIVTTGGRYFGEMTPEQIREAIVTINRDLSTFEGYSATAKGTYPIYDDLLEPTLATGNSILLAMRSVDYSGTRASVGTVQFSMMQPESGAYAKYFDVRLQNPVEMSLIEYFDWTLSISYKDKSGKNQTKTVNASSDGLPVYFYPTLIGNNEYDYTIKIRNSDMPSNYSEINSYTLVLKFYRYDDDLEAFISSDIAGSSGEKVTMGQDEDNSIRFERTWVEGSSPELLTGSGLTIINTSSAPEAKDR